ncbi:MAG: anti-sigma factor family protein [bacterium]
MLDEKIAVLIHREIDGELSGKDKKKLHAYLESHPEAKQFQDDLIQLSKILDRAEPVDPDPNLKKSILNLIPKDKYPVADKAHWFSMISAPLNVRVNYKYAFSFSAGLVAGFFILLLFKTDLGLMIGMDSSNLTGSAVFQSAEDRLETVDTIEISETSIHANFESKIADDQVVLNATISTFSETKFTLGFDPGDLQFSAFQQSGDTLSGLILTDKQVDFTNMGQNKFVFVFNNKTPVISYFTVKIDPGVFPFEQTLSSGKAR